MPDDKNSTKTENQENDKYLSAKAVRLMKYHLQLLTLTKKINFTLWEWVHLPVD